MMADTAVSQEALAGFLLSNPNMASFELLTALRTHPVGDAFPQYQMLEKSGGLNGSSPAEVVAMFLKADDCDGVQIVADCLRAWNACVATDPALSQPWRQMLWLAENVPGMDAPEKPTLMGVAATMAALSAETYDQQRKSAAKALGVRVTVLDRAVESIKDGGEKDDHRPHISMPNTGIPLKLSEKGRPLAIVFNAIQILEQHEAWRGVLAWDEFSMREVFRRKPPFLPELEADREITDADVVETAAWMQQQFDLNATPVMVHDAVSAVSARHRFHPVRDYLGGLTWDGTPRIDHWLTDYFDVERTPYSTAVASMTLIGAVARIYQPGCKLDTMTILESPQQGLKKSSAWRTLAGDEWFSDSLVDVHGKDAMDGVLGKWMIEMSDLSAISRADVEAVKRFLSQQDNHYRPAYGRRSRTFKRQCIFVASSNRKDYLKDTTGNRRFWPVECRQEADLSALREARDQLWAEAAQRFLGGSAWHLEGDLVEAAEAEQEQRMESDEWESPIESWLALQSDDKVFSAAILEFALGLKEKRDWTTLASRRVAAVMQKLAWVRQTVRIDGVVGKGYRKLRSCERYRRR